MLAPLSRFQSVSNGAGVALQCWQNSHSDLQVMVRYPVLLVLCVFLAAQCQSSCCLDRLLLLACYSKRERVCWLYCRLDKARLVFARMDSHYMDKSIASPMLVCSYILTGNNVRIVSVDVSSPQGSLLDFDILKCQKPCWHPNFHHTIDTIFQIGQRELR